MNVIKDVIFKGTILKMVRDSIAYLDTQIKEKTYLGANGTFITEEEYPKFVRQEIIVNAVTHNLWKAFHNLCYAKSIVMQSWFQIPHKIMEFGTFCFA